MVRLSDALNDAVTLRRVAARAVDIALALLVWWAVAALAVAYAAGTGATVVWIIQASFLIVCFVLAPWKSGVTPGKRLLGVRVIALDGALPGLLQALLREWVIVGVIVVVSARELLDALAGRQYFDYPHLPVYLGGLLAALGDAAVAITNPRRRALHDFLAGTMVVRDGVGGPTTREPLCLAVGCAALVAPALHSLTDAMEWLQGGYSPLQLVLNYLAFLPLAWLLLGLVAVAPAGRHWTGVAGAILFGAAFTYFTHTTLVALDGRVPDYAALWSGLGVSYTVHGALMVVGGLLFAWNAWRAQWFGRLALGLFVAGLAANLSLALLPLPDLLQVLGSGLRNAGLCLMGWSVLRAPGPGTSRTAADLS